MTVTVKVHDVGAYDGPDKFKMMVMAAVGKCSTTSFPVMLITVHEACIPEVSSHGIWPGWCVRLDGRRKAFFYPFETTNIFSPV